jgi:hypothetical protein
MSSSCRRYTGSILDRICPTGWKPGCYSLPQPTAAWLRLCRSVLYCSLLLRKSRDGCSRLARGGAPSKVQPRALPGEHGGSKGLRPRRRPLYESAMERPPSRPRGCTTWHSPGRARGWIWTARLRAPRAPLSSTVVRRVAVWPVVITTMPSNKRHQTGGNHVSGGFRQHTAKTHPTENAQETSRSVRVMCSRRRRIASLRWRRRS